MVFDSTKKITFQMGVPQTFILSDWSPNQWGKMRYNTADGRFFDASPGLSNLLGEMNLAPNTEVTIVKQSNVGKDGTDYGKFYVNGQCMDDVKNGTAPVQSAPVNVPNTITPPSKVSVQPNGSGGDDLLNLLQGLQVQLDQVIAKVKDSALPF